MKKTFIDTLKLHGITCSDEQFNQLETYFELLVEWNEKMNLTAITEKDAVFKKHFYDSLTAAFVFDFNQVTTICDVGSGAGFPSFVLKIFFPHLEVTIVEALEKRIKFLIEVSNKLNFSNVILKHARAEEFAETHRETFDVVTARAVARLPMLAELCIPLVKQNGYFIALKGEQGEQEFEEAWKAFDLLGIGETSVHELHLDEGNKEDRRVILLSSKVRKTPQKYPRHFSQIKKKPL